MSEDQVWGEGETLHFKGAPVRAIPIDGVLWYALPDLVNALGYKPIAGEVIGKPWFPSYAVHHADELPDPEVPGEPQRVTILSPVGVFYWTHATNAKRGQNLCAWAKREAFARLPQVDRSNRHMFLTPLPDMLPPYPMKYSGRKAEWIDLKDASLSKRPWPY